MSNISGHKIKFKNFDKNFLNVINRQDVCDVINLLFNGSDSNFLIIGHDNKPGRRGSCKLTLWGYIITIDLETIRDHIKRGIVLGGNKIHKNVKTAVLSVLAHEIQHANQFCKHGKNSKMWTGGRSYLGRPAEIEARNFADKNTDIIENMLDMKSVTIKKKQQKEDIASEIASIFAEQSGSIKFSDIRAELKLANANNPVDVEKIMHILTEVGKKIIK